MAQKISFRFYNDQEVRASWNSEENTWYFSIVDIVAAITGSPRPRVYWGTLKSRLKAKGNELYSNCIQLKLPSKDGKKYNTDCIAAEHIKALVRTIPSKNADHFLDWFTYSDNSIDGQSRKKAYALWESGLMDSIEVGTTRGLQQIHAYLFGGLYDFAGQIRTATISKGDFTFCRAQFLPQALKDIDRMADDTFDEIVAKYVEMNVAHPFMEGNGRSTRLWLDLLMKNRLGLCVDWSRIAKRDYLNAMILSATDPAPLHTLLKGALTDKINDRELFLKGIDYSYYYEQEDYLP